MKRKRYIQALCAILFFMAFNLQAQELTNNDSEAKNGISLEITLILEGAFITGDPPLMHTHLSDMGLLPSSQPFAPTLPYFGNPEPVWYYPGDETLEMPTDGVVDWVLLELRDAPTPELAFNTTVVARQAALLLSDGSVVGTDGLAPTFNVSYQFNLYVVVYHRNHLAIISSDELTETRGVYSWDFTRGNAKAFDSFERKGLYPGMRQLKNGFYVMIGGDGDGNGQVQTQDKNEVWSPQSGLSGYLAADFDLNGQVQTQDKNNIWNPNSGQASPVPGEPTIHTLTLQVSPGNSGVVTGAGSHTAGTTITITATPNGNYQFVNWTGDTDHVADATAASTTLLMPAQHVNLTANFVIGDTEVVEVLNPATGKIWMDRNLGATRAATSSNDAEAYGDMYQWGRASDGHQVRTSGTTHALSTSDTPGHGYFIIGMSSPYDWRSPQNNNLWQGVNGTNNPCPAGYRLPTDAEFNAEILSWSSPNAAGAFASPLKLPAAGYRYYNTGGFDAVGAYGRYWSSGVDGIWTPVLCFDYSSAFMSSGARAYGQSVRCIKDYEPTTYTLNLYVSPEGSGQVIGTGEYTAGTTITITATPNENYQFVNWTDDTDHIADASAASTTLLMPAQDVNLTANFEEVTGWPIDDITEVVDVLNPTTGKTWMDRNLGASRAATSSADAEAYGHLYQWGRAADGHQIRTSGTTTTLSNSDTPGHGNFILAPDNPSDWRSPQNTNLWQDVNGTNNPCPVGYRLPTNAELNAERASWSSNSSVGAFASPLKLPVAGYRKFNDGSLGHEGPYGYCWSGTVSGTDSGRLYFGSNFALIDSVRRAYGFSVRCIKD